MPFCSCTRWSPYTSRILQAGSIKDVHLAAGKTVMREMKSAFPTGKVLTVPRSHVIVQHLHHFFFDILRYAFRACLRSCDAQKEPKDQTPDSQSFHNSAPN